MKKKFTFKNMFALKSFETIFNFLAKTIILKKIFYYFHSIVVKLFSFNFKQIFIFLFVL